MYRQKNRYLADVRSIPESRHQSPVTRCPLSAISGLMHRRKQRQRSINLSAVIGKRGGTTPLGLRLLIAIAGLHLALPNIEMLADLHRTVFSIAARASGRRAPARRIWSSRQRPT